jgi:hypothetical protein
MQIFLGGDGEKCQLQGLEVFSPKEIHAESTSRIKHQEERLKKQRRKGGFDYPKI